jgi:hypothetical protein
MSDAFDPHFKKLAAGQGSSISQIHLTFVTNTAIRDVHESWDGPRLNLNSVQRLEERENPFVKYLKRNKNPSPIKRILRSVDLRWSAFAILEYPYFDLEFWDAHAGFYDRCFFEHPRECERFHFFSNPSSWQLSPDDETKLETDRKVGLALIDYLNKGYAWDEIKVAMEEAGGIQYHGYCIMRPTLSFSVGRTAIEFDGRSEQELQQLVPEIDSVSAFRLREQERHGQPYLKASHECHAHLLRASIGVNSTEFIQQDPNLGGCATASLWAASRATAHQLDLRRHTFTSITRQALQGWNRDREADAIFDPGGTDEGLYPAEIQNALGHIGANPVLLAAKGQRGAASADAMRLRQELYSFVESKLPVIACLNESSDGLGQGHAMTLVGHNLASLNVTWPHMKPANSFYADLGAHGKLHYLVSSACPLFYAHDDRHGPFNRFVFSENNEKDGTYPAVYVGRDWNRPMYLEFAVIPRPPVALGTSEEPLKQAIRVWDTALRPLMEGRRGVNVLWRPFLVQGSEFKKNLGSAGREVDADVTRWYSSMLLPKYIWVLEYSIARSKKRLTSLFPPEVMHRRIHGEFIYDATMPKHQPRCIAARFMNMGVHYGEGGAGFTRITDNGWAADPGFVCYPGHECDE